MSKAKQSAAIKNAISPGKTLTNKTTDNISSQRQTWKPDVVYFHLEIYDDTSDPDWPTHVEKLEAGKTYTAVISCEDQPSLINKLLLQKSVPITDPFTLALFYKHADEISVTTPIHPSCIKFTCENPLQEKLECSFTIPSDFPSCQLSIELAIKKQNDKRPIPVTKYPISVKGCSLSPQQEILTISQINERLPEKTAILLATPVEQKQQVRLRGWSEAGQQLDDVLSMNTIVSIEELRAYRRKKKATLLRPDQMLQRLHHFSRNNSQKLLCWLNGLSTSYEEQLHLVIVDLTKMEIPWELLQIEPEQYLGACTRVVRWLPTQYFQHKRELSIQPGHYEGSIVSYLDERMDSELIKYEKSALDILSGKAYLSLPDLRKRLQDSLEEIGLIYVGCHGREGRYLLQQDEPQLSSIMLEGIYACQLSRLIVFLNSCESARIIKKSPDDISNFVDTFLAYGASGFIGTLAQIDIATASIIAEHILRSALQPGGVQIAEKLRLLRKAALEQLKRNVPALRADYHYVIDTFMYVFYGNPLARLQLYPKEECEE